MPCKRCIIFSWLVWNCPVSGFQLNKIHLLSPTILAMSQNPGTLRAGELAGCSPHFSWNFIGLDSVLTHLRTCQPKTSKTPEMLGPHLLPTQDLPSICARSRFTASARCWISWYLLATLEVAYVSPWMLTAIYQPLICICINSHIC